MNKSPEARMPASVAENIETVLRVAREAFKPSSRSEALADAIRDLVGTISFVALQALAFAG